MYLFLLYEVNKNLQTMEKYKTVCVVGLGKKLDISYLKKLDIKWFSFLRNNIDS